MQWLAARLAQELTGVVLCKEQVRAALFPPPVLDYSWTTTPHESPRTLRIGENVIPARRIDWRAVNSRWKREK